MTIRTSVRIANSYIYISISHIIKNINGGKMIKINTSNLDTKEGIENLIQLALGMGMGKQPPPLTVNETNDPRSNTIRWVIPEVNMDLNFGVEQWTRTDGLEYIIQKIVEHGKQIANTTAGIITSKL